MGSGRRKTEKADRAEAQPAKHQGFVIETVHRGELKGAAYNPRKIRDENRARLKANLARVGLTHPVTWNRRTGNLVSGHQRVGILDSLEGTKDYTLQVAVVDLSPEDEMAQNVHENNTDAMGEWDWAAVEKLVKVDRIDIQKASMDAGAVAELFGDASLGHAPERVQELADQLRASQEAYEKIKQSSARRDRADYYRVFVFPSGEAAEALGHLLGYPGAMFLPGDVLMLRLQPGEERGDA